MTAAPLVRPGQRGTAIIEFAIALPLLLFLLLATAETGRLLSQYDTLNKAVRDAARYLATNALGGTTGVVSITPQLQTATANLVVTETSPAPGPRCCLISLPAMSRSQISGTVTFRFPPPTPTCPCWARTS